MCGPATLFALALLAARSTACLGNGTDFAFSNSAIEAANLTVQCASTKFTIDGSATLPIRMTAWPVRGSAESALPTTRTFRDGDSWTWTPPYSAGTRFLLSMTAADGRSGGTSPVLTVQPSSTAPALVVTINTTLLAPPCSALRIRLAGGQRPYAIVVAQASARRIANVTLAPAVDTIDFVGIANLTSGNLIVSASDAAGHMALASVLIGVTAAATNAAACPFAYGFHDPTTTAASPASIAPAASTVVAGTGDAAVSPEPDQSLRADGNVLKVVIGVVGAVIAVALFIFLLWLCSRGMRRAERRQARKQADPDWEPIKFERVYAAPTPGRVGRAEEGAPSSPAADIGASPQRVSVATNRGWGSLLRFSEPRFPSLVKNRSLPPLPADALVEQEAESTRASTVGPPTVPPPTPTPPAPLTAPVSPGTFAVANIRRRLGLSPRRPRSPLAPEQEVLVGRQPASPAPFTDFMGAVTPSTRSRISKTTAPLRYGDEPEGVTSARSSPFSPAALFARVTPMKERAPLVVLSGVKMRTVLSAMPKRESADSELFISPQEASRYYDAPSLASPTAAVAQSYAAHADGFADAFVQLGAPRRARVPPSPSTRPYSAVHAADEDDEDENDESLMHAPPPDRRSWLSGLKRNSDASSNALSWNGVVTSLFEDEPQVGTPR